MCNETQKTIVKVSSCPKDEIVLQERSQQKGCNMYQPCHNERLQYHCVRFKDIIVEVCAPVENMTGNCESSF